jgi:hypothetical protein
MWHRKNPGALSVVLKRQALSGNAPARLALLPIDIFSAWA